jgi:L-asparagine transporter-like permease
MKNRPHRLFRIFFGCTNVAISIVLTCLLIQQVMEKNTIGILVSIGLWVIAITMTVFYIRWDREETKNERWKA